MSKAEAFSGQPPGSRNPSIAHFPFSSPRLGSLGEEEGAGDFSLGFGGDGRWGRGGRVLAPVGGPCLRPDLPHPRRRGGGDCLPDEESA